MGVPEEFGRYVQMCRNMRFEEKPDYHTLKSFFQDIMKRFNYQYDCQYDWIIKKNGGKPDTSATVMMNPKDSKPPMP